MEKAWALARKGAKRFGGKPSIYFACALRLIHADARLAVKRLGRPAGGKACAGRIMPALEAACAPYPAPSRFAILCDAASVLGIRLAFTIGAAMTGAGVALGFS